MSDVIRYYPLNQLGVLLITNAHLPQHVETGTVSILVLLINPVSRSQHVQLTTIEQDVSVHQDMKATDFHHVQRLEKENVNMMWIVLTIELVYNISALIHVSC